mmetsp:Transcript_19748/g.39486  ORF Transcript_19748/g.39486 Transcript_19748/m.39486 type:complete len:221 (-) Transcript_19748:1650-2312(-)
MPSRISGGMRNPPAPMPTCDECARSWCCCFYGGGCDEVSDEELKMRDAVSAAARGNDYKGLRQAISVINKEFGNPAKLKAACNMWAPADDGPESKGLLFMTALKWAAQHGNVEMCQLLLKSGANLHTSSYFDPKNRGRFRPSGGLQPLGRAAQYGHTACAKFLVEAGADPNYRDFSGDSAADLAGKEGRQECQKYLWSVMENANDKQQRPEVQSAEMERD